jgi:VanZ family protein
VLAVIAVFIIAAGSLMPASGMPERLPWDKASHFIAYAGLAALTGLAGIRLSLALALACLLGVAIEFLQLLVAGRSGGDWADILANSLGAGSGVLLLHGLRRGMRQP